MNPMTKGLTTVNEMGDIVVKIFTIFAALAGVTALIAMIAFYQFLKRQRKK